MSGAGFERDHQQWEPTTSHARAVIGGTVVAIVAAVTGRPDLLVIATPLLVIAIWSVLTRPTAIPQVRDRLSHRRIREGEATHWTFQVLPTAGTEEVVAWAVAPPTTQLWPNGGVNSVGVHPARTRGSQPGSSDAPSTDPVQVRIGVRSTRWGRREIGPAAIMASSSWNAFRWQSPQRAPRLLVTVPAATPYGSLAPSPRPRGLVGLHRSSRRGEGTEFASIRPFQTGDRLRRIHWPVSLRVGTLQVTATWAEQDTHVVLVVDAINDIGESGGIDGVASSLDVTARAAGALAEHYLVGGDRVELRVVDVHGLTRLPAGAGRQHLIRVLDVLSAMRPGSRFGFDPRAGNARLPAGGLILVLSPLVSTQALQQATSLARSGLTTLVVDTLPADVAQRDPDNPFVEIAWRIRLLERDREMRRVQELGVPIVRWVGPGSLDEVLRGLSRRTAAPRMRPQ
jgi:uncharacterized protein (DUF58 family)